MDIDIILNYFPNDNLYLSNVKNRQIMLLSFLFMFNFFLSPADPSDMPKSIYEFKVPALDGSTIDFSDFKGKKILIVNTASKCGNTPQYEQLEAIYEKYNGKLVVVGFPANNFMRQEPGSNEEIAAFCEKNYGVTFPMAAKISVKGSDQHPLYVWLTNKKYNKVKDSKVKWNFQKYLIAEDGSLIDVFGSRVKPYDAKIIDAIEK